MKSMSNGAFSLSKWIFDPSISNLLSPMLKCAINGCKQHYIGVVDGAKVGDVVRCMGMNPTIEMTIKHGGKKKFGMLLTT